MKDYPKEDEQRRVQIEKATCSLLREHMVACRVQLCRVRGSGPTRMLPRLRRLGHWNKVHGTYCLFGVLAPQASSRDEESHPVPGAYPRDRERQEFDMSEPLDWNAKTIAEFRANEGKGWRAL